ncbi:hypothetical protein BWQ96_09279 [Gracilariopsis chorda]|uniref:Uncharacterized protein n=1 Tax=Gracilariopsis chorda TaxID=448386 RepID=A0A2V3IFX7_9FLOR|nr:hypothetical protein BWQ96_09279 [Gracilariopsis chorda]|eukprot:PXF40984.1 hypothetical protein BWQ96_09279 [Gracilariopsis chorda]
MAEENTHEELFYEKFPYEIRFLLLGKNRRKVLMTRDGGEWDLPVVEYQSKSGRNLATRCCHDMGKAFSGECEVRFAAVIELLGKWLVWSRKKKKKRAHAMLVLAECVSHEDVENLVLPHDSEWKNSSFVSSILSAYKETFRCVRFSRWLPVLWHQAPNVSVLLKIHVISLDGIERLPAF